MPSHHQRDVLIEARLIANYDDPKQSPNSPARLQIRVAVGGSKCLNIEARVNEYSEHEVPRGSDRDHAYLMMDWLGSVLKEAIGVVKKECPE